MRRIAHCMTLLIAVCAGGLRASEANADETPPPSVIDWRQSVFSIPFRVNADAGEDGQVTEVRLLVSSDQGQSWVEQGRISPDARRFIFRAPRDGEYWFALRTVDASGTVAPARVGIDSALRVNVDTLAPQLKLNAVRGNSGEVHLSWEAIDPHLVSSSLSIQQRSGDDDAWKPISLDVPEADSSVARRVGQLKWWPNAAVTQPIQLRAEIVDRAGNRAVSMANVDRAARSDDSTRSARPSGEMQPIERPSPPAIAGDAGQQWPGDILARRPLIGGAPAAQIDLNSDATGSTVDGVGLPNYPPPPLAGEQLPAERPKAAAQFASNAIERFGPPPLAKFAPNESADSIPSKSSDRLPAEVATIHGPQMVRSRHFELQYDVQAGSGAQPVRVELWGTRDGGQNWFPFGVDADNKSPLQVRVDAEGVYGFRIVVQNSYGGVSQRPQPGDMPEVTIGVDSTPPVVQLVSVMHEPETDKGSLTIRWNATDANFDALPISLSYSLDGKSGWQPIARRISNSSEFLWQPPHTVPPRAYIRLEAVDLAGNLVTVVTPRPATIRQERPAARIRSIRPILPFPTRGGNPSAAYPPQRSSNRASGLRHR